MKVQSSTVHKLCNVMPCNTYLFYESCTKSQHITKVESDIRKIDNRCCYRRESELTVQTRNTCYQLQKIVLVFFFFLFRYYSFIRFMTIYYTQATFSDIHRLSRQDRKTNRHESRRETPTWKPAWKLRVLQTQFCRKRCNGAESLSLQYYNPLVLKHS